MNQCREIREKILQRTIAAFEKKLEDRVEAHLSTCQACSQFNENVIAIAHASESVAKVHPAPALKRQLLNHMRSKHTSNHNSLLSVLRRLFSTRIAIYQAAFVTAVLILLVLAVPQLKSPHQHIEPPFTSTIADTVSMNVINLQQIIQIVDSQKVGLNLHEDTVLAKILYTL